jgi:prevent-host-death family protein
MFMLNVAEAKAQLSDLLERVAKGESVLICKRNQPVAELRPVAARRTAPRALGQAKTLVEIPEAFFEPLPDEDVEAFEGGFVYPPVRSGASRVAESRGTRRGAKRR